MATTQLNDEETAVLIEENDRFQRVDSLAEMIAQHFRVPQGGEKGRWYSSAEILSVLQSRFGQSTMARYSAEKIGSTLSGRQFNLKAEHKAKGNCYLPVEM